MNQRSDTWADIDARAPAGELGATARVGGLPLVVRQLRQAARLGWAGARVIVADPAARAELDAALARYPVTPPLSVEIVAAPLGADVPPPPPPRPTPVQLDGRALYPAAQLRAAPTAPPSPLARVRTASDLPPARRALFGQIRKSVALDGVISYYVMRPIARVLTRALLPTRISPNQVTAAALACGLSAALLAAHGGAAPAALAGLLYWLGGVIDHSDGELARLRLEGSRVGEWMDAMSDEAATFGLLLGLGVGLFRDGAGPLWLVVGAGGCAVGVATVARLYTELHRRGLPIDTAQFPWFFNNPAAAGPAAAATATGTATTAPGGLAARVVYALGFLIRRDANVTGVAVLLLFDQRRIAASLMAAGAAVGLVLTITHYAVMATRPAQTPR